MSPIVRLTALATSAFLAAAASACSSPTPAAAPDSPNDAPADGNRGIVAGTLEATAKRPTITLRNTTEFVVGYLIVEKHQAVIALYPPCNTKCATLVQGATATVSYKDIAGYSDTATTATLMWWTYTRAADGTLQATGAINTRAITL